MKSYLLNGLFVTKSSRIIKFGQDVLKKDSVKKTLLYYHLFPRYVDCYHIIWKRKCDIIINNNGIFGSFV